MSNGELSDFNLDQQCVAASADVQGKCAVHVNMPIWRSVRLCEITPGKKANSMADSQYCLIAYR